VNYNEDLIEAFALMVEMEGMKSANKMRELNGQALAYGEESFRALAEDLRNINKKREKEEKDLQDIVDKLDSFGSF
jgi:restriction endonuclease